MLAIFLRRIKTYKNLAVNTFMETLLNQSIRDEANAFIIKRIPTKRNVKSNSSHLK